jgi:hypothetical protein
MGRIKGEAGVSPALTRSCKSIVYWTSQIAPLNGSFHNLAERMWGTFVQTNWHLISKILSQETGFFIKL